MNLNTRVPAMLWELGTLGAADEAYSNTEKSAIVLINNWISQPVFQSGVFRWEVV